ncbi:MAG: hypothetical protein K2Y37_15290 [Pirellulales bacterium]|nr:hypothetical protein [Pirellulales bacterium]
MSAARQPAWTEVESPVPRPGGRWVLFLGGFVFLMGAGCFAMFERSPPPDVGLWVARAGTLLTAVLGAAALAVGCDATFRPRYVRHAAADVLADVPREPVIVEGANVHGRLTHELVESADGWHFRPATRHWHNDRRLMLGFGIPFLLLAAGFLSWFLHRDGTARNWPLAILAGGFLTVSIGGTVFWLMVVMLRWSYERLPSLAIPRGGDSIEFEGPVPVDHDRDWLKYGFAGNPERQQLTIPAVRLAAVQLCPWKFVMGGTHDRSITWAVQGLLVVTSDEPGHYERLPILLSSDATGAARLMRGLADVLGVPYLFHADAAGWQQEEARAKTRLPVKSGGIVS